MKKAPLIIFLAIVAILIWFRQPLISLSVMPVYSAIHAKNSIPAKNNFIIKIPGGLSTKERDWYPFVMTFNADGYKARNGEISGMTILYNFPAFNLKTGTNIFYEPDSFYNSAFYGAYIIETGSKTPYCFFENGDLNLNELMHAFNYDYKELVLKSLGTSDFIFHPLEFSVSETDYLGITGWKKVQAVIKTNSVTHNFKTFHRSYLQYGHPIRKIETDFKETIMYGLLYARYFPRYHSTIIMYATAPKSTVLNHCDEYILSKSKIISR